MGFRKIRQDVLLESLQKLLEHIVSHAFVDKSPLTDIFVNHFLPEVLHCQIILARSKKVFGLHLNLDPDDKFHPGRVSGNGLGSVPDFHHQAIGQRDFLNRFEHH